MNKISLKRLKKEDLCFENINQETLYDYDTIDDFFEEEIYVLGENIKNNYYLLEKCKHLKVFSKDYFKIGKHRIEEYIQDYFDDNYGNSDDYTVTFSEEAVNLLNEFLRIVEYDNQIYTTDNCVGYIDLSEEFQVYINDNYIKYEVKNDNK